jgi:hypothetical protein
MNTKKFYEIVRILLQTTIWAAVCVIIADGTHAYAEHSHTYWIIFFSIIFIVNYPVAWVLVHYLVLPIIRLNKHK